MIEIKHHGPREAELAALRQAGQELLSRCGGLSLLVGDAVPPAAVELRSDRWEYVLSEILWIAQTADGAGIGYWDRPGEPPRLVYLSADAELQLTGRTALDHMAWMAPAERAALQTFARQHGLPEPMTDPERAAALSGQSPPTERRWRVTPRRLGFQDHDVGAFILVGIALHFLDYRRRLVAHNRCRRLSELHGVALRCVPAEHLAAASDGQPVTCLLGVLLGEAYCEDSAPVPLPAEMLRDAALRALRLPEEIWRELQALAEEHRDEAPTAKVLLGATGPLAGAALGYGVLLRPTREELFLAAGEDPADCDEEHVPESWDWDLLKPDGAPAVIDGNRLDQSCQKTAVAGVAVGHVHRWQTEEIDLSEATHEARQQATSALVGLRSYFLMARYG